MRTQIRSLILLLLASPALGVDLLPGDVVVLDPSKDAVVRVRPSDYNPANPSINQALITSDGNLSTPFAVAIGDGVLYVTDSFDNTIIKVNPATGAQSLVPLQSAIKPRGIDIASDGMLFVGDAQTFALVEVDPDSGAVASLTPDLFINTPTSVHIVSDDEVFIIESNSLKRLDIPNQEQERVGSDAKVGIVIDPATGDIYSSGSSDVFRYDPDAYDPDNPSANRTSVYSEGGDDLGLLPNGDLVATCLVVDGSGNVDLARLDPDTGVATIATNGGELLLPSGLAVVTPEPEPGLLAAVAMLVVIWIRRSAPRS